MWSDQQSILYQYGVKKGNCIGMKSGENPFIYDFFVDCPININQEKEFKIRAQRNKLLGLWAAEKLQPLI